MADDPEFKEAMRKAGGSTVKSTPAQFRAQIDQEMAQWKPLVAEIVEKEKKKAAHVPEKWEPVFRKGHAPINQSRAHPDQPNRDAL